MCLAISRLPAVSVSWCGVQFVSRFLHHQTFTATPNNAHSYHDLAHEVSHTKSALEHPNTHKHTPAIFATSSAWS